MSYEHMHHPLISHLKLLLLHKTLRL